MSDVSLSRRWLLGALLALSCLSVVLLSVWQGAYNLDPHHWGLMLSNAKDLAAGRIPYRDIFIQYGFLTTLLHSVAYALLGENLRALILMTSLAYAVGLLGIYYLSLRVTDSRKLAIYSMLSVGLLHGVAMYPWSNYIAFPFLVYGAWAFLSMGKSRMLALLAGVLLALAVLAREGLLPPVFAFALLASLCGWVTRKEQPRGAGGRLGLFWFGLLLPIVLFFAGLQQAGLTAYWYKTSVQLPRLYVELLLKDGLFGAVLGLAKYFLIGVYERNSRIFFLGMVVLAASFVALGFLIRQASLRHRIDLFLLAAFSLLLLSASLHLNEIFRLATSLTVGSVLLYWIAARYRGEDALFILFAVVFAFSMNAKGNGNYFFPQQRQILHAVEVDAPAEFRGQRWPQDALDYYVAFERDMDQLRKDECGLRFHHNGTRDAFLAVLSPFMHYQLAPFGSGMYSIESWNRLRPEFDLPKKVAQDKDIVLFLELASPDVEAYAPPVGYVVARRYPIPKSYFFPQERWMLIVIPVTCRGLQE